MFNSSVGAKLASSSRLQTLLLIDQAMPSGTVKNSGEIGPAFIKNVNQGQRPRCVVHTHALSDLLPFIFGMGSMFGICLFIELLETKAENEEADNGRLSKLGCFSVSRTF